MNIVGSMTPWGEFGDIGEGGFNDFISLAFGLTDEPGRVGIPVGDPCDIIPENMPKTKESTMKNPQ